MSSVSIVIKAKSEAKAAFDRVKGDVKNLAEDTQKATSGMKAAHEAVAKAMRGDLVGAAQSAASAFKALWAVVISNPILLGIAAAAAAIALLAKRHMEAATEARNQAIAEKELNDEIARTKGHDPASVKKENANRLVEKGDLEGLSTMRDKYLAEMDDAERAMRGLGEGNLLEGQKARFKEMAEAVSIYSTAIERLAEKTAKAAEDSVKAREKEAAAEKAASDQALANKDALIKAEREMQQELDATLNEYERQIIARESAAEGDIAAFEKMVSRRKELEGATDAVTKAEIERKHILEDIAEMQSGESVKTLEYMKKQEELRLKEVEIANIKDAAAKKTAQESLDRLKGANDVLAVEGKIKKVKEPDAWDNNGWRAKDPRKGIRDPWDDLKNKKPEFPPPIPPMPLNPNAPGQLGGRQLETALKAALGRTETLLGEIKTELA